MVQPAAAAGPAMAAALNDHDCMKQSTDIPLFFAHWDKDTVLPRILIDRIEDAAEIATWDATRKIRELKLCFRENTIIWWKSLRDYTINLNDWDEDAQQVNERLRVPGPGCLLPPRGQQARRHGHRQRNYCGRSYGGRS